MSAVFGLEAKDAIEYINNKGLQLTYNYDEMKNESHHKAFTVAKVTRLDVLNDLHNAVAEAIKNGTNFNEFKNKIKPTLQSKGWWGTQEITDPKTGETKEVYIGSRRLKTIIETNVRVAYQVGKYKQMRGYKKAVYWRYVSALLETSRKSHKTKHGIIKHRDDEWWRTNYPPNGWGCKCTVTAHTKSELEVEGWKLDTSKDNIADKDWAYDVGAGSQVSAISKINLDSSLKELPTIKKELSYKELSDNELKDIFYKSMALKSGDTFIDKIGDPTVIDDNLFTVANGFSKISKQDRHLYLDEFANLLKDPDEIYLQFEKLENENENLVNPKERLVKKFIKYYQTSTGAKRALIAIFEYQKDKTQGVTLHFINSAGSIENKRNEKLIYVKD